MTKELIRLYLPLNIKEYDRPFITDGITQSYITIEKSTLVIANMSKFRKNAQQNMFECLFGLNSLLKSPTVLLYCRRLTGIA